MFWGLVLEPGKRYSQKVVSSFHVSMATLELNNNYPADNVPVMLEYGDGREYLLCNLHKFKMAQCQLDLNFKLGEQIGFYAAAGKCKVHLTGYILDDLEDVDISDEEDEEEEEEEEKVTDIKTKDTPGGSQKRKENSLASGGEKKQKLEADDEDDDDDDDEDEDFEEGVELNDSDDGEEEEEEVEEEEEEDDDDEEEDEDEESEEDSDEITTKKVKTAATPKKNNKTPSKNDKQNKSPANEKQKKLNTSGQTPKQPKTPVHEQNGQMKTPQNQQSGKKKINTESPKASTPQGGTIQKRTLNSGVEIVDVVNGTGAPAKMGRQICVYYVGKLKQNNKQFDATTSGPGFKFTLGRGEVIKGWDIGVLGMKVGGKRTITIPPSLAYGRKGQPPVIPPQSTLVFDVELRSVN